MPSLKLLTRGIKTRASSLSQCFEAEINDNWASKIGAEIIEPIKEILVKIFVSYAGKYVNHALDITEKLRKKGFTPFIDKELLSATGYWLPQILDKVKEANIFLFLLSNEALFSVNCLEEFNCAVDHRRKLILAKVTDAQIMQMPEYFHDIEMVNFAENDHKGDPFKRLCDALHQSDNLFQLNPSLHRLPIDASPNAYQRALSIVEGLLHWLHDTKLEGTHEEIKQTFIRLFTLAEVIRDDAELTVQIQHIALFLDQKQRESALNSCLEAIQKVQELKS